MPPQPTIQPNLPQDPSQMGQPSPQPQGGGNDLGSMLIMYLTQIEEKVAQLSQEVDTLKKGAPQQQPQTDEEAVSQGGNAITGAFKSISDRFTKNKQDSATQMASVKQQHSKELQAIMDKLKEVIES